MENTRETLSKRIREKRDELGFTQSQLAELTGLTLRGLQEIEYQRAWVSSENLAKLAAALLCPVSELLDSKSPKVASTPSRVPRDIREALERCDPMGFEMIRTILKGRGLIKNKAETG